MENGKQKRKIEVKSGKWEKLKMENGKWKVKNGKWKNGKMENGE